MSKRAGARWGRGEEKRQKRDDESTRTTSEHTNFDQATSANYTGADYIFARGAPQGEVPDDAQSRRGRGTFFGGLYGPWDLRGSAAGPAASTASTAETSSGPKYGSHWSAPPFKARPVPSRAYAPAPTPPVPVPATQDLGPKTFNQDDVMKAGGEFLQQFDLCMRKAYQIGQWDEQLRAQNERHHWLGGLESPGEVKVRERLTEDSLREKLALDRMKASAHSDLVKWLGGQTTW